MSILEKSAGISNGLLSGRIYKIISRKSSVTGYHLYLTSDSAIPVDKGEFLSIPINDVTRVELKEVHEGLIIGLLTPLAFMTVVGISVIITKGLGITIP